MSDARRLDEWDRAANLMTIVVSALGKKCKPSDFYPPLAEVAGTNGKPPQGHITDLKIFLPHGR